MMLYVALGLEVVGLLVAGIAVALQSSRAIAYKVANVQFAKLAAAKNLDRAVKLARSGNDTTYMRGIADAIHAGARAGSTDTTVLAPTIQIAFDEAGRPRAAMWRRLATIGLVGTAAAITGAAMAIGVSGLGKHGYGSMSLGFGLVALFLGFGFAGRFRQVDAALADARHTVLPLIVEAFASGSTLRPDDHRGA